MAEEVFKNTEMQKIIENNILQDGIFYTVSYNFDFVHVIVNVNVSQFNWRSLN